MPNGLEYCASSLKYRGLRYIWGGKDPSKGGLDCSGLTWRAAKDIGIDLPHGAQPQRDFCRAHGTLISVADGIATAGALLFRIDEGPSNDHVAVSLGNGSTMEAHSKATGCGVFSATVGRRWTHAARVFGISYVYGPPPAPPPAATPNVDWAGLAAAITFCKARSVLRRGDSNACVKFLQAGLNNISGRGLAVDGVFGAATERAVRDLQTWVRIPVDGIVGPQTWAIIFP